MSQDQIKIRRKEKIFKQSAHQTSILHSLVELVQAQPGTQQDLDVSVAAKEEPLKYAASLKLLSCKIQKRQAQMCSRIKN